MSSKIIIDDGFSFSDALERAKTNSAYYEEDLLVIVAERVNSAMKKQDVSRSELARRMEVSPAYITKILRGHANLGLESLARLAFALELKWECLLIQQDCSVNFVSGCDASGEVFIGMTKTVTLKKSTWGDHPHVKAPREDEYSFKATNLKNEYKEIGRELSFSA